MALANLTPRQAWAAVQALDSYLLAGDYDEQLAMFGSAQEVQAATRARDELARVAQPYLRTVRNSNRRGQ
jgi:hypothetical protein